MDVESSSANENEILLLLEQKSVEPPKRVEKPLSFERLNAGITTKSQAWLFQLPFDILDEIFNYIPHRSLPSFALASRDCCRLARGRQFTNVVLDYSPNSWSLAHRLLSEADLGNEKPAKRARLPAIGPAVRQVSICTAKEYIQQYNKVHSIWELRRNGVELIRKVAERYMRYIRTVQMVLANSLPNVETIIWADRVSLNEETYLALCRPSIQNLILNETAVDRQFFLDDCTTSWSIRTLHLGMADLPNYQLPSRTRGMCNALLRMCAPHLESLAWVQRPPFNNMPHSFSGDALQRSKFTALRQLKISGIRFTDDSVFETLITPSGRLRRLDVQYSWLGAYLAKCGTINSLDSLTWLPQPNELDEQLIAFLRNNCHLKKLCLRKPYATGFLNTQLLPLLGSSFESLTSLSLIEYGTVFEESSLELIGKIHTLEQLHLSAGDQMYGFVWVVDDEAFRRNLLELSNLKTLLLSRDVRTMASNTSSEIDDSSTESNDDTSSMTMDDNPNTDLDAIIAAVNLAANGNVENEGNGQEEVVAGVDQGNQEESEDSSNEADNTNDSDDETDNSDGSDFSALLTQPNSLPGSGFGHDDISRIMQRMRDERVEQEAQKYFTAFKKLEMVYIGRQVFDRGYNELTGRLWRSKRWADPEDLLPSMLGRVMVDSGCGFES